MEVLKDWGHVISGALMGEQLVEWVLGLTDLVVLGDVILSLVFGGPELIFS